MIFRRGDDRHELVAALGRRPDRLQRHARGLGGQRLPVAGEVTVVREFVVGADLVAEEGLRGRQLLREAGPGGHDCEDDRDGRQGSADRGPVGGEERHVRTLLAQITCGIAVFIMATGCPEAQAPGPQRTFSASAERAL